MEFLNNTPYNAGFFNTVVSEDGLLASVVCKPTFRIDGDTLAPAPDAQWPVGNRPVETEYGVFDGELPFIRRGCDFIYIGKAYAPGEHPVPEFDVEISVGSNFRRSLRIFGDRFWKRNGSKLEATRPRPLKEVAVSYKNAFGGVCECETGEMQWPANPEGKGFYIEEWQAEGQPLPNIEDPEHIIKAWDDKPDTIGTAPYPQTWGLRMMNALEVDNSDTSAPCIKRILPTYFNNAHPKFIITNPIKANDLVMISNGRPDGDLRFRLPGMAMHIHVQLGRRHFLFPLHLEQISIIEKKSMVFFSFRVCFRYRLVPLERRMTTLYAGEKPERFPGHYIRTSVTREVSR